MGHKEKIKENKKSQKESNEQLAAIGDLSCCNYDSSLAAVDAKTVFAEAQPLSRQDTLDLSTFS